MERRANNKVWVLREDKSVPEKETLALASATGLSHVTARLLYHRGYRTFDDVMRFLRATDTLFHSPFLLRDVDRSEEHTSELQSL